MFLRAGSSSWGFWAGCTQVEESLRSSSCPGNGEGLGQFAVWMCRVGRVCCLWVGSGAEQAGVSKISGVFWEAFQLDMWM